MANNLLCEAEKIYALHGVQENFRVDGRQRDDYRPMELETDFLPQSMGSARLRLANTDIIVGVHADIDNAQPDHPNEGKIEFFVDCSANATPAFEGRGGEQLATEISNSLKSAFSSSEAFNLTTLCIIPKQIVWKLFVDILILECGGNLFDAASLAVKAALHDTKLPALPIAEMDGRDLHLDVTENPYEYRCFNITKIPVMVTLCKIGEHCVVDPTADEEQCCSGSLVLAISGDRICSVIKQGAGSFHPTTLLDSLSFGETVGKALDKALLETLARESEIKNRKSVKF